MTHNPPPMSSISDVVGVFVLLGTAIFSPEVAEVVGPYLAVFTASFFGAAFALERRTKTSRLSAMWFFFRVCGASIMLTSIMAAWVVGMHPSITERAALVPIAFFIGIIGDDYPALFSYLVERSSDLLTVISKFKGGPRQ